MFGDAKCKECGRKFWGQLDLKRHIELRHGPNAANYAKASGNVHEAMFAAVQNRLDWLEDEAGRITQHIDEERQRLEQQADEIRKAGKLDYNGKAPKPKAEPKKRAKKAGGVAEKWSTDTVGRSPASGGTAPPGKPHWDSKHGRWTARKPGRGKSAAQDAKTTADTAVAHDTSTAPKRGRKAKGAALPRTFFVNEQHETHVPKRRERQPKAKATPVYGPVNEDGEAGGAEVASEG